MTVSELVQLYAPLAGLLALAFWTGGLTQKVVDQNKCIENLEEDSNGGMATVDRLARLETKVDTNMAGVEKLNPGMEGVQR